MDDLEKEVASHRRDDEGQFAALRSDIANLGVDLGQRMDKMRDGLQSQIDEFTEDKIKAAGRAEGLAEAARTAAAAKSPKWWLTLMIALGVVFLTALIGLIGWMGSTIWSMEQEKITAAQSRPAATVTVNPVQPQPPASTPTIPAPPAPDD